MNFNDLNNTELSVPNDEISILDGNHCTSVESFFTITKNNNVNNNNFEFSIFGEDKMFKGNFKDSNITLKSNDDLSIFCLKNDISNDKTKKKVYINEFQENAISEINSTSNGGYKVNFKNLSKGISEYFEMVSDSNYEICDIFYGDRQYGAPVICKIIRKNDSCEVRMSSKVDYIFIIGLASFFFCKDIYVIKNTNNSYDNIARMDMPSVSSIVNKEIPKDKLNTDKYINIAEDKAPEKKSRGKDKTFMALLTGCLCCYCCCNGGCCCDDDDDDRKESYEFAELVYDIVDNGTDLCCECGCCDGIGECCGCSGECGACLAEVVGGFSGCTIM